MSKTNGVTRSLPAHIDAERSVLGALLVDHAAAVESAATLAVDDFQLAKHRVLFRAILATQAAGGSDAIAVLDELERAGRLEEAGGRDYLFDVAGTVLSGAAVGYHAQIVREHAERRRVIEAAARVQVAAEEGAGPDELRAMLAAAAESTAASDDEIDLVDWHAIAEQPAGSWLVDGILPRAGLVVLAGDPGSGKSALAHDLALRAAHGRAWLGRGVTPHSTLILAGEGAGGLPLRMRAWQAANPAAVRTDGRYVLVHRGMPELSALAGASMLRRMLDRVRRVRGHGPDVVVVDTLARALGSSDENDAAAVGSVLSTLAGIQHDYTCCILVLHHVRKPTSDRGGARSQHDLRGSSALAGAADAVLLATRTGDAQTLHALKVRDGESWKPIPYAIQSQDTGLAREDGRREVGPVVALLRESESPTAAAEPDPAAQLAADVAAVVGAITTHGRTSPIDAIGSLAGIGRDRGRVAVRLGVARGELVAGGSTRDRWYDIPSRANHPLESSDGSPADPDSSGSGVRAETPHTPRPRGRANGAADHAGPIRADRGEPRESARIRANPEVSQSESEPDVPDGHRTPDAELAEEGGR